MVSSTLPIVSREFAAMANMPKVLSLEEEKMRLDKSMQRRANERRKVPVFFVWGTEFAAAHASSAINTSL